MKNVRKMIVITATTAVTTLRTTSSTGTLSPSTPAGTLRVDRLADAVDDLVVVLEAPERPASAR